MASDNVIFERVMRMPALDEEWQLEEQTDEHLIFKGAFGHAEVKADGRVVSQVAPYVSALEAAIKGEELPVKPKAGRSQENKTILPLTGRKSNVGQMRPVSQAVRDIQVADLTMDDIKQYLCPKATDQEAFMFLKLCQARGMNPFLKEAYLIKYSESNPATMVVGKEHFTKTAEKNSQFDGFEAGVILKTATGIERREGTFYLEDEELVGGWAKVWRKDRKMPFYNEVRLKDFAKYTASKKSPWDTMEGVMIRKVPLVQSLREAFPNDFAGCYDESEMGLDPEQEVKV